MILCVARPSGSGRELTVGLWEGKLALEDGGKGMLLEWDAKKATANLRKHGVSFAEASTVFGDPLSTAFPDPDHSVDEQRYLTIGLSTGGTLMVVGYTEREGRARIITARKVTPRERTFYEKHGPR